VGVHFSVTCQYCGATLGLDYLDVFRHVNCRSPLTAEEQAERRETIVKRARASRFQRYMPKFIQASHG
jgi:hypothetical protein